uniref:Uncharacterized protein n=1 Tax=Picea glauca TaxID=3330 RepID=A0A101M129_PICGL|nr:hypothetical protein ABT39_MTgene4298 [Picea glauca]
MNPVPNLWLPIVRISTSPSGTLRSLASLYLTRVPPSGTPHSLASLARVPPLGTLHSLTSLPTAGVPLLGTLRSPASLAHIRLSHSLRLHTHP